MKKIKIALHCRHAGLIRMFFDLWEEHDVRLQEDGDKHKLWEGDEDIVVATFPYDRKSLDTDKPTIVYFTDPTYPAIRERIQKEFNNKKISVIGAEDCYPEDWFIKGIEEYIPFAFNSKHYPSYHGSNKEVIIINQKAVDRWREVITGASGANQKLEEFLEGIPWKIIDVPENQVDNFRQEYAYGRVLFYYSNSPYTVVMFEAMTVGIPIVAFNHCQTVRSKPIEKYLPFYSTDKKEIVDKLKYYLDNPPKKVDYSTLNNFEETRKKWNDLFRTLIYVKS